MKILYWMDPLVDLDDKFDDRSFVAKYDLNADCLPTKTTEGEKIEVGYLALSSLLDKREIRKQLTDAKVKLFEITKDSLQGFLGFNCVKAESMILNEGFEKEKEGLIRYYRHELNGFNPDVVIYWETASIDLETLFPDAIFLEGSHSGFWTIEQNPDILFTVRSKGINPCNLPDELKNESFHLNQRDIGSFKKYLREYVATKTQISRESLDPTGRFKYFILYAGNFPSLRFKKYSGCGSNAEVLSKLIQNTPDNCAILYSPHHLDKTEQEGTLIKHERVIDLSRYKVVDKDFTLRVLTIVDAIVNVYSNIYMPAMALDVPVFSFGTSPNTEYALGSYRDIKRWLFAGCEIPETYKRFSNNVLNYILVKKINSRFIRTKRNSILYIEKIINNLKSVKKYTDILPELSTPRGYLSQLKQNLLLNNKFNELYNPTQYEVILGLLLSDKFQNVGFDIFDTLVYRPMIRPTDLFDLMEIDAEKIIGTLAFNFSKSRIMAEAIAREGKLEVTLNDIYHTLQALTGIDIEKIEKLKKLERAYEEKYLMARESALQLYQVAKALGKRVFIASDMYLDSAFLSSVLKNVGYDLSDTKIYVSCEQDAVKYNGSLFKKIIKTEKLEASRTIFIGDNEKSDVRRAAESGLYSFHYPKAYDRYKETRLFSPMVLKFVIDTNFNFHIGLIANKLFDNPFAKFASDSLVNNSARGLGYIVFGPLVLSLTVWLIEKIKQKNYDKVLFCSRDCRVIVDIYNQINQAVFNNELPRGEYIYISRTATLPGYCKKKYALTLLTLYNSRLSSGEFLEKVFNVDLNDRETRRKIQKARIDLDSDARSNFSALARVLPEYFEEQRDGQLEALIGYFKQFLYKKNVAMFDLGSKGTARDILSDLFDQTIDLYLFRTIRYKWHNNICSYLKDSLNPYRHGIRALLPQFYELLLSDPLKTTCSGYVQNGSQYTPIVEDSKFTKSMLLVLVAQYGMKEFCKDYIDCFGDHIASINSQTSDAFTYPISYLCANTTDTNLLSQFEGDDPFWTKDKISVIEKKNVTSLTKPISVSKNKTASIENLSVSSRELALLNKVSRTPVLYFRDSKNPLLRIVYKAHKLPLIGTPLLNLAKSQVQRKLNRQMNL